MRDFRLAVEIMGQDAVDRIRENRIKVPMTCTNEDHDCDEPALPVVFLDSVESGWSGEALCIGHRAAYRGR